MAVPLLCLHRSALYRPGTDLCPKRHHLSKSILYLCFGISDKPGVDVPGAGHSILPVAGTASAAKGLRSEGIHQSRRWTGGVVCGIGPAVRGWSDWTVWISRSDHSLCLLPLPYLPILSGSHHRRIPAPSAASLALRGAVCAVFHWVHSGGRGRRISLLPQLLHGLDAAVCSALFSRTRNQRKASRLGLPRHGFK